MKTIKCELEECLLPENNNRYLIQFVYLIGSLILLFFKPGEFTFLAIAMFTMPIIMDLHAADFSFGFLKFFKKMFISLNWILLAFSVLGAIGCFVDSGSVYSIPEGSVILSGQEFNKKVIASILLIDLVVPIVFFFGSPCKSQKRIRGKVKGVRV